MAPRPAGPATALDGVGVELTGATAFVAALFEAPGIGIGERPAGAVTWGVAAGVAACGVGIGARPLGAATVGRAATGAAEAGGAADWVRAGTAAAGVVRAAG